MPSTKRTSTTTRMMTIMSAPWDNTWNLVDEPEAVFGQMKADMHYKRFRHFGMDKVYIELGLFGMGFNLKKYLGIKR